MKIRQQFVSHLNELDIKFIDHEKYLEIPLPGVKLKFIVHVIFGSSYVTSIVHSQFNIPEEKIGRALEKINYINTKMPYGHLEISKIMNNSIIAKYGITSEDLSKENCDDLLFLPASILEQNSKSLNSLMD